jgi:predicted transcriptional regulator
VPQQRRPSGELESEVLGVLWAAGEPMTPAQVREALDDELAYTTVMTTLARLHEKGSVHRHRAGRAFAYEPAMDVAAAAAEQMRRLLDRGDHETVLARFVGTLDAADGRLLSGLLKLSAPKSPSQKPSKSKASTRRRATP